MFFHLPSHDFLNKSFAGAKAWNERGRSTIPTFPPSADEQTERPARVTVDKTDKTYDVFTLYTMTEGAQAKLLDMRGNRRPSVGIALPPGLVPGTPCQEPSPRRADSLVALLLVCQRRSARRLSRRRRYDLRQWV